MADPSQPTGSWTDAFPAPRTTAPTISREHVLSDVSSPDLLLVDVRRTDYEGGTISGSINLPAHSFYMNRGVLYDLCRRAGVKRVAFYCGKFACLWSMCRMSVGGLVVRRWGDLCSMGLWLRLDRIVEWERATVLGLVCGLHCG